MRPSHQQREPIAATRRSALVRLCCFGLLTLSATGCAPLLGTAMVAAPNHWNVFAGPYNPLPPLESFAGADQNLQIEVGPPWATLSVSLVEPHQQPRGTVLVLHGVYARSIWMMGVGRRLADAGYRAVLVDLRGHGRSSGKWLTYGLLESQDLSQVIDELARRRLLVGRLGVYGISYGATTAVHLAGRDRRVQALVAVAPFSSMREELPDYVREMVPLLGSNVSDETLGQALAEAGQRAGFNPDAADAVAAIRRTTAPVLLVHGEDDTVIPPEHSLRLHGAAPRSRLVVIPGLDHLGVWRDPKNQVAGLALRWFDRWLAP